MSPVRPGRRLLSSLSGLGLLCAVWPGVPAAQAAVPAPTLVPADAETVPTTHVGDTADDPAIWVHPTDPGASLLIGNDKLGALEVYALDGGLVQRITSDTPFWGNVDVRQGVTIASRTMDVVATYNGGGLRLYTVDPASRRLSPITEGGGVLPTNGGEGLCLQVGSATGRLSAVVITRPGQLRQFVLADADDDGLLDATLARDFAVGSEAEGCVADDELGRLYVSEEDVGLWRYGAEPGAGTARTLVDSVQPQGQLSADVEGVTLVDLPGAAGYVIASAQNTDDPTQSYFTVYDRRSNAYVGAFRIVDGTAADGCSRTDGITAYSGDLGPRFPTGVFVCQDDDNRTPGGSGNQDFKLTRLDKVVDLDVEGGNVPPTASFTSTCTGLTCTFDAAASSDPEGPIATYAWDFGDGAVGQGRSVTHGYASGGPRTVTLTVRDAAGATGSTTATVTPTAPSSSPTSFVAAASTNGNRTTHAVQLPPSVVAGDTLLLFFTGNLSTTSVTGPSAWTAVRSAQADGITTGAWTKQATATDAGSVIQVSTSAFVKADITVAAYRGTGPPAASAVRLDTATSALHTTPTVTVAEPGGWLVSYWADKSSATTAWSAPGGQTRRSGSTGTGGGHITSLLTDTNGPVAAGPQGGLTASADAAASRAGMVTIALPGGTGTTNEPPTATFTVSCVELECSFDGSGSTDIDGGIASFAWDFGDGATGSGPSVAHTYATAGPRTVRLTVTDDDGASASTTRQANPAPAGIEMAFVAAASTNGNRTTHDVRMPNTVQTGDALLLFFAGNVSTTTVTGPAGWTLARSITPDGMQGRVWWKVAGPGDAGAIVSVTSPGFLKSDLTVAAYRGTAAGPIAASAVRADLATTASHATPQVEVVESGSWLISYWADKSSATTRWVSTAGQTSRTGSTGTGGGHITAALADSAGPVAPGMRGALTATADAAGSRAVTFSVVLRLAG